MACRASRKRPLNSAYDDASPIHWPEMIELFATKSLGALSGAIAQSPEQFGWLLAWQRKPFLAPLPEAQRARLDAVMAPLIADNFIQQPSSGPAFVQLASQFFEELARNSTRLPELKVLDVQLR
jgi:haloalkane dehalogenase